MQIQVTCAGHTVRWWHPTGGIITKAAHWFAAKTAYCPILVEHTNVFLLPLQNTVEVLNIYSVRLSRFMGCAEGTNVVTSILYNLYRSSFHISNV